MAECERQEMFFRAVAVILSTTPAGRLTDVALSTQRLFAHCHLSASHRAGF